MDKRNCAACQLNDKQTRGLVALGRIMLNEFPTGDTFYKAIKSYTEKREEELQDDTQWNLCPKHVSGFIELQILSLTPSVEVPKPKRKIAKPGEAKISAKDHETTVIQLKEEIAALQNQAKRSQQLQTYYEQILKLNQASLLQKLNDNLTQKLLLLDLFFSEKTTQSVEMLSETSKRFLGPDLKAAQSLQGDMVDETGEPDIASLIQLLQRLTPPEHNLLERADEGFIRGLTDDFLSKKNSD